MSRVWRLGLEGFGHSLSAAVVELLDCAMEGPTFQKSMSRSVHPQHTPRPGARHLQSKLSYKDDVIECYSSEGPALPQRPPHRRPRVLLSKLGDRR